MVGSPLSIEVLDLSGEACGEVLCVKSVNLADTAHAVQQAAGRSGQGWYQASEEQTGKADRRIGKLSAGSDTYLW